MASCGGQDLYHGNSPVMALLYRANGLSRRDLAAQRICGDHRMETPDGKRYSGGIGPIEFDCIDCSIHVYGFGKFEWERANRCATCQWLSEIEDPEKRERLRRWLKEND